MQAEQAMPLLLQIKHCTAVRDKDDMPWATKQAGIGSKILLAPDELSDLPSDHNDTSSSSSSSSSSSESDSSSTLSPYTSSDEEEDHSIITISSESNCSRPKTPDTVLLSSDSMLPTTPVPKKVTFNTPEKPKSGEAPPAYPGTPHLKSGRYLSARCCEMSNVDELMRESTAATNVVNSYKLCFLMGAGGMLSEASAQQTAGIQAVTLSGISDLMKSIVCEELDGRKEQNNTSNKENCTLEEGKLAADDDFALEHFDTLKEDRESDLLAESIPPVLAVRVNDWFRKPTKNDEMKEICSKLARPANCTGLKPAMINSALFDKLTKSQKQQDKPLKWALIMLSKVEGPLTSACAKLITNLRKLQDDQQDPSALQLSSGETINLKEVAALLGISLQVLGHTNVELMAECRYRLRDVLATTAKSLADRTRPFSDNLFGDDLTSAHKEAKEN